MSFNPAFDLGGGGGGDDTDSQQQEEDDSGGIVSDTVDTVQDTASDVSRTVTQTVDDVTPALPPSPEPELDPGGGSEPTAQPIPEPPSDSVTGGSPEPPPAPTPEPEPTPVQDVVDQATETATEVTEPARDVAQDVAEPVQEAGETVVDTVTPEQEPPPTPEVPDVPEPVADVGQTVIDQTAGQAQEVAQPLVEAGQTSVDIAQAAIEDKRQRGQTPAAGVDEEPGRQAGVEITGEGRVREQAREFEQQVIENTRLTDRSDISIRTEQRGDQRVFTTELTPVGEQTLERQEAARIEGTTEGIDIRGTDVEAEQTARFGGVDLGTLGFEPEAVEDVPGVETQTEFELTESGQQAFQQAQEQQFREEVAGQVSEQTGVDVTPGQVSVDEQTTAFGVPTGGLLPGGETLTAVPGVEQQATAALTPGAQTDIRQNREQQFREDVAGRVSEQTGATIGAGQIDIDRQRTIGGVPTAGFLPGGDALEQLPFVEQQAEAELTPAAQTQIQEARAERFRNLFAQDSRLLEGELRARQDDAPTAGPSGQLVDTGRGEVGGAPETVEQRGPGTTGTLFTPPDREQPESVQDARAFFAGIGRAGIELGQTATEDFGKGAATEVSPHAVMSLDQEGLAARSAREDVFAERAEAGFEAITRGELPTVEQAGAGVFQAGEIAERGITTGAKKAGEATDVAADLAKFNTETMLNPKATISRVQPAVGEFSEGDIAAGADELSGEDTAIAGQNITEVPGDALQDIVGGFGMAIGAGAQYPVTKTADEGGPATAARAIATPFGVSGQAAVGTLLEEGIIPRQPDATAEIRDLEQPQIRTPGGISPDASNQAIRQQVAARNPGIGPEDVTVTRTSSQRGGQPEQLTDPLGSNAANLSNTEISERVADANQGVSPSDVQVSRFGNSVRWSVAQTRQSQQQVSFDVDLDREGAREQIAAQSPGVAPDEVRFREGGDPFTAQIAEDGETPTETTGFDTQVVNTAESQAELFQERPVSTALIFALPAAEAGTGAIRGFRAGRGRVPLERITTERGLSGEVPAFETSTRAPTKRAVAEVRRRAGEQPESVLEGLPSDTALFHSTPENLGRVLEVGEGGSELPGLFTAPDVNPVGLSRLGGERSVPLRERLMPDLRTQPDRIAAFEGDRITGMPERAQGQGYEVRRPSGEVVERGLSRGEAKGRAEGTELEYRPQSDLPGFDYLTEQAELGTAQVKPTGTRSPEIEAIFPPESRFQRTGGSSVELPSGESAALDFFRRVPAERAGEFARSSEGELLTAEQVASRSTVRATTGPSIGVFGTGTFAGARTGTRQTRTEGRASEPFTTADSEFISDFTTQRPREVRSPFTERFTEPTTQTTGLGPFGSTAATTSTRTEPTATSPFTSRPATTTRASETATTTDATSVFDSGASETSRVTESVTESVSRGGGGASSVFGGFGSSGRSVFAGGSSSVFGGFSGRELSFGGGSSSGGGGSGSSFGIFGGGSSTYGGSGRGFNEGTTGRFSRDSDDDEDEEDNLFPEIGPQTPEFVNPVVSGSQFVFGSALGGSVGGSATENVASVLPVGQDAQGQPTGEVEPLSERGRDALDSDPFNLNQF